MIERILKPLNERQKAAVTAPGGPLLIIAGAGSGKTRALTHRIAYLLHTGTSSDEIVALTFTNKAAAEMKERITSLIGLDRFSAYPFIGTFHALGLRILREHINTLGRKRSFTVYDQNDQRALIKEIMADENVSTDRFRIGGVQAAISIRKNDRITPAELETNADGPYERTLAQIYGRYEEELRRAQAVDFDDLLVLPLQIFESTPVIAASYAARWKHILVDEYQDTNRAQYDLLRSLASQHQNLCVVGDDWQSIYSFRGADFRNILQFERDFPNATIVFLEENYRSTQVILDTAQSIIEKNIFRTDKRLWTNRQSGKKSSIVELANDYEEGVFIANEIERLSGESERPLQYAVLYRTNAQSRAIEDALVRAGIPYAVIGAVKFWERREIKDIIAYLRLIANPADVVSFRRIINVPTRGIGKKTVERILGSPNDEHPPKVQEFFSLIAEFRSLQASHTLGALAKKLLERIRYERYINDGTPEGESRWENIRELLGVLEGFAGETGGTVLEQFLEHVALLSPTDDIDPASYRVHLMTIHAAKGLEFDVVFLAGCEEGLLPHERSLTKAEDIEEERRLCYVGITRAREKVYFSFARTRNLYGAPRPGTPSRFIAEIPAELIDYTSHDDEIDIIEI